MAPTPAPTDVPTSVASGGPVPTTVAPATTVPANTVTPTTVCVPTSVVGSNTTIVAANGCPTTPTTVVGVAGPTPGVNPGLPATGSRTERQVQIGLLALLGGAYLMLLRRRASRI